MHKTQEKEPDRNAFAIVSQLQSIRKKLNLIAGGAVAVQAIGSAEEASGSSEFSAGLNFTARQLGEEIFDLDKKVTVLICHLANTNPDWRAVMANFGLIAADESASRNEVAA